MLYLLRMPYALLFRYNYIGYKPACERFEALEGQPEGYQHRMLCPTILNQGFTVTLVNLETSMKASSKEGTMNGTLHSLRMSPSTSSYSSLFCRSVSISTSRALSRIRLAENHMGVRA